MNNDYAALATPLQATLARLGIATDTTDRSWPRLGRRTARALIEAAEGNICREHGIYAPEPRSIEQFTPYELVTGVQIAPVSRPLPGSPPGVTAPAPSAPRHAAWGASDDVLNVDNAARIQERVSTPAPSQA